MLTKIILRKRFVKDTLEACYKDITIDSTKMGMYTFSIDVQGRFCIFAYQVLFQIVLLFENMQEFCLF